MNKLVKVACLAVTIAAVGFMAGCGGGDDGDAGGGATLSGAWFNVDLTSGASSIWTINQNGNTFSGTDGSDPLTGTINGVNVTATCTIGALTVNYTCTLNAAVTRLEGTWNNVQAGVSGPAVIVKRRDGGAMTLNGRWKVVDVVPGTGAGLDFDFTQTGNVVNGVNAFDPTDTYVGTLDGTTLSLTFMLAGAPRGTMTGQMFEGGNLIIGEWTNTATGTSGRVVLYLVE